MDLDRGTGGDVAEIVQADGIVGDQTWFAWLTSGTAQKLTLEGACGLLEGAEREVRSRRHRLTPRLDRDAGGTVAQVGESAAAARRDGSCADQVCRDHQLAVEVVSPGDERSVSPQGETVLRAARDFRSFQNPDPLSFPQPRRAERKWAAHFRRSGECNFVYVRMLDQRE